MKFADFRPGQAFVLGPISLTEDEIVAYARQYDPQWFHTDKARADAGRWNGLIASGWQTCGVAMRLVVDALLADSDSFASPGLEYLKWLAPVRAGDALTLHADVIDVRRSARQPALGILKWRWRLVNQNGADVLELVATSLFDTATAAGG